MPKPDKEPFEIVFAGFVELAALDVHMVERDLFPRHEIVQVEAHGANIGGEFGGVFLKHHEHARFVELRRAANQEFQGQHRLAAPRAARDECGPPSG